MFNKKEENTIKGNFIEVKAISNIKEFNSLKEPSKQWIEWEEWKGCLY